MNDSYFGDISEVFRRELIRAGSTRLSNFPACYIIEEVTTGRFYVGSTNHITQRINSHRQNLRHGCHPNKNLQRAYDESFDKSNFMIYVAKMSSIEAARKREQLMLDEGLGSDVLFNIMFATIGFKVEDPNFLRPKLNRNVVYTPELKEKISKNSKAMWENPKYKKAQIARIGHNVIVNGIAFGSVREASRELGVSILTIRSRLVDGVATLSNIRPPSRKVSVKGVVYNSLREASKAIGIADNTLTVRCQSKAPQWADHFYIE